MPKRAVSVSLGSSARDKCVVAWLLGQEITLERIGTDGDTERATRLFQELDGHVDALGVGGIDLGLTVNGRYYPLHGAQKLVTGVRHTPVVDGGGLKTTLEHNLAQFIEREIGDNIQPKQVLVTAGVDRYGSALSFDEADYEILFGGLGFALGVPLPIRSLRGLQPCSSPYRPLRRAVAAGTPLSVSPSLAYHSSLRRRPRKAASAGIPLSHRGETRADCAEVRWMV